MTSLAMPGVPTVRPRFLRLQAAFRRLAIPASLRNLLSMPLTVLGLIVMDAGVFTQSVTAGLLVMGVFLIALEYLIADEQ